MFSAQCHRREEIQVRHWPSIYMGFCNIRAYYCIHNHNALRDSSYLAGSMRNTLTSHFSKLLAKLSSSQYLPRLELPPCTNQVVYHAHMLIVQHPASQCSLSSREVIPIWVIQVIQPLPGNRRAYPDLLSDLQSHKSADRFSVCVRNVTARAPPAGNDTKCLLCR